METEELEVVEGEGGARAIERAAALLRAGGLVAFPTETVYGLGALALDPNAVGRIFEAKGRPSHNPLIVHVSNVEGALEVVSTWPKSASALADAFWPGPLTLVLPKDPKVPAEISAGLGTVGVRAPAHPVARRLLERVGAPIAAPSANRYMAVSPTTAAHVAKGLLGRIDAILDGGSTPLGIESTVLDLSGELPVLLRPGAIAADEIEAVVGPIARGAGAIAEGGPRASPGLDRRHYAPDAAVEILAATALRERLRGGAHPPSVGVIARGARPEDAAAGTWLQLPDDAAGYSRQLYAALHALEDAGVATILVEEVPAGAAWDGVRDRLSRAGG